MAQRPWGPFSIPGEQEVEAERRGSGVRFFLWVKLQARMCEVGREVPQSATGFSPPSKVGRIGTFPMSGKADWHNF